MYGHCERVYTENLLWKQNLSRHRGLEPASVSCLAFQSDALPTELSPALVQNLVTACGLEMDGNNQRLVENHLYFITGVDTD